MVVLACSALVTVAGPARVGAQSDRPSAPVVRIPFPQEDGSLTPYTFDLGYPLMTLVYDTLFWRDADGRPQPWLARSADVAADGMSITLRLADGARWQDGRPVTAADVAFTFAYMAAHPHPRFTPELEAVARADAVDASTVTIALRHPAPGFMDQPLADMPILPAHVWRDLPAGRLAPDGLPMGSGPYRLVEHRPGESYRFEADPTYFRGAPAVAGIEVPIIVDAEATFQALERRQVDVIPASLSTAAVTRLDQLGISLAKGPSYLGTVLVLNVRRPPFDQAGVRRAVSAALDLGRIARTVGNAVPADHGYLHPESPWASTDILQTFDGAAAHQGLDPAALGPVEILAPAADPEKTEAARQVALALQRAGVAAESKPTTRQDLAHQTGEDGSPPTFQAVVADIPALASYDPNFLAEVFGSDPKAAPLNVAGYRSPAFDQLARSIASATDDGARRSAVSAALRLLAGEAPVVPLFFANGAFAYRPAIYDGWVFVRGSGILDKRSFVEPVVRSPAPAAPVESATGPAAVPARPAGNGGALPAGWVAAGVASLVAALFALGVLRRRL